METWTHFLTNGFSSHHWHAMVLPSNLLAQQKGSGDPDAGEMATKTNPAWLTTKMVLSSTASSLRRSRGTRPYQLSPVPVVQREVTKNLFHSAQGLRGDGVER